MKRTELKRGKPLKRGSGPKRTGTLKPVSDRRRKRDAGYPESRTAIYSRAEGMCEARCTIECAGGGHQVHHIAGRGGPDPHRLDNLLLCCAPCHDHIHANPERAYANGWMASRHGGDAA